jgi:hypothetical protein
MAVHGILSSFKNKNRAADLPQVAALVLAGVWLFLKSFYYVILTGHWTQV